MNVKIIRSREDHAHALARVSALMSLDPGPGSKEENELELLALVIESYERKTVPPVKPDPVESILFRMDQMKLGRKDLVPCLGSISKVSEVLSRKRPLSLPMIRRLNKELGIPADVLIADSRTADDGNKDDAQAIDCDRFPLKEMLDRGCFAGFEGTLRQLKAGADEVVGKFMQGLVTGHLSPALLRAPMHQRGARKADEMALLAWRLCVLKKARENPAAREYRPGSITPDWLREFAKLSAFADGPRLAGEYLSRHGIPLVIVPHFNKTFLDGAAMLDKGRPIVALTLRHDRFDNFWFALAHELAHVARHLDDAHPVFIDDLDRTDQEQVEIEADAIATEALIPSALWQSSDVRRTHRAEDALELAHRAGVHPAVVAGRLRHETKDFRLLASMISKAGRVGKLLT